jgi:hypothetical protein
MPLHRLPGRLIILRTSGWSPERAVVVLIDRSVGGVTIPVALRAAEAGEAPRRKSERRINLRLCQTRIRASQI